MKRTQFNVQESDKEKRKEFYEYIKKNYKLKIRYPYFKRKFINSDFPFVVDFKEKDFWICDSITCCAMAAQNHVIFTIDEFKEMVKEMK